MAATKFLQRAVHNQLDSDYGYSLSRKMRLNLLGKLFVTNVMLLFRVPCLFILAVSYSWLGKSTCL